MKKALAFYPVHTSVGPNRNYELSELREMAKRLPEFDFVIFLRTAQPKTFICCKDSGDCRALLLALKDFRDLGNLAVGCDCVDIHRPYGFEDEMKKLFKGLVVENFQMIPSHPKKPDKLLNEILDSLKFRSGQIGDSGETGRKAKYYIACYVKTLMRAKLDDISGIVTVHETAENLKKSYPEDQLVQMQMDRLLAAYSLPKA